MMDEQERGGPIEVSRCVGPEDEYRLVGMIYSVHPDDRERVAFKVSNLAWHDLVTAGLIIRALYHEDTDRLLGYPVSIRADLDGLAVSLEVSAL